MWKTRSSKPVNWRQNKSIVNINKPGNAKHQLQFLNHEVENKANSGKCKEAAPDTITSVDKSKSQHSFPMLEINNTLFDSVNLNAAQNSSYANEDIDKRFKNNDNGFEENCQVSKPLNKEELNCAFVVAQKPIVPRRKLLSQHMTTFIKNDELDSTLGSKKRHSEPLKALSPKKICISNDVLNIKDLDNVNSSCLKDKTTDVKNIVEKLPTLKYINRTVASDNVLSTEILSKVEQENKMYENKSPDIFSGSILNEEQRKLISTGNCMTKISNSDFSKNNMNFLEKDELPEEAFFRDILESSIFSQDIDMDNILSDEKKCSLIKNANIDDLNIVAPKEYIISDKENVSDYEMSQLFKSSQLDNVLSGIRSTQNNSNKLFSELSQLGNTSPTTEKENVDTNDLIKESDLSHVFNLSDFPEVIGSASRTPENINNKQKVSILSNQQIPGIECLQLKHFDNDNQSTEYDLEFSNIHKSMHKQNEENVSLHEALDDLEKQELLSQMYKSSQYRKEIQAVFDACEFSICQNNSIVENFQDNSKNNTTGTDALQNDNWENDSLLNNIIEPDCKDNSNVTEDILNGLKQRLIKNATMDVVPKTLVHEITQIPIAANIPFPKPTYFSLGPYYGLPKKCQDLIRDYKGINKLYDWQNECLNLPAVNQRKNLIYALPTSGGKTLVAEILILRELVCRKKNVIFILPFVSIVQEKIWALSPFAIALDFLVEEYAGGKGSCPPRKRRHKRSVYIATIEKSLGLLNSLAETGRMNEIGLIVVDELHLLGDGSRGATLEAVLTKALFVKEDIHIIGMSATIGNLNEIAKFMKAEIYTRNFRPVELKEYVKCGSDIFAVVSHPASMDESFELLRKCNYEYSDIQHKIDPDQIGGLVLEVIPQSSCLIFCPSKKNCENVALLLCRVLPASILNHRKEEKNGLKKAILRDCGTMCSVLSQTLPLGVAYHHSGLTSDERKHLEDAFRAGVLCVICCTSTLAAGVNLPAKRVILRSPYVGRNFINLSKYKQMVGRAGRAGMGETGESILIFSKKDVDRVKTLLCSPMDEACSNLHINDASGLKSIILSAIGLNMAITRRELYELIKQTLMAVQNVRLNIDVKKITDSTISTLFKLGALKVKNSIINKSGISETSVIMPATQINGEMINNSTEISDSDKKRVVLSRNTPLEISKLGKAAIRACIDLKKAHMLYEDLVQAQAGLVLIDCLHLLYLVTPYEQGELIAPNPAIYYSVYIKLGAKELLTANILGINELCATRILSGKSLKSIPERVVNRFYVTLMLYDLWNNTEIHVVAEKYQVARGIVQSLMTSAASFSSNVLKFCEELEEFWVFKDLLVTFTQRLQYCCSTELLPLMDLPSVKQGRAKQLYNAGFKTLHAIAKANADSLIQNIEHMNRRVANQLIAAAKLLLLEKVESLREEAEDVLEGLGVK